MKKEDLLEFTIKSRVMGPERSVTYTVGDIMVPGKALVIHGISAEDAWQIISTLDRGLFNEGDVEEGTIEVETADPRKEQVETAEPKKRKRRTKAEMEAAKEAKIAEQEETAAKAVGAVEVTADDEKEEAEPEPPKKNGKSNGVKKVGGLDLEQFKSATGLRNLVSDFKEAGVETKEEVVAYCTELQEMGVKCLRGVSIERRVANLWDMVA